MGKVGTLILAAGRGTRMGTEVPKQFLEIGGRPLFLYSVEKFLPLTDRVMVVTGEADLPVCRAYLEKYGLSERVAVTKGGRVRAESSYLGLQALTASCGCEYVMIHDAARAGISAEVIERCLETVKREGTAVAAVPVTDTVKVADRSGTVLSTPDRSSLYAVQTPQAFRTELLKAAFERLFSGNSFDEARLQRITDDASVVEQYTDHPVKLFPGSYENRKITVPSDLSCLAQSLLLKAD